MPKLDSKHTAGQVQPAKVEVSVPVSTAVPSNPAVEVTPVAKETFINPPSYEVVEEFNPEVGDVKVPGL
ncbi:MAG: hypothetical protein HC932_00230 [Thermales bacterium]|nr:hypothetical protein [Thermales bacterium]